MLRERAVGVKDILAPDPPVRIFRPENVAPVGRVGLGMALGILGQVGVQVELVAELPCEDAFVFPQGCDDVGRVGFQELCRFAARPAPSCGTARRNIPARRHNATSGMGISPVSSSCARAAI